MGRKSVRANRRQHYFFKLIQRLRNMLPPWMPTIGIEGGRINIVPVDFVAAAIDYLAHKKGLDGKCFHLTDPEPHRIGEVLNIFAKAAHAPQITLRINARMFGFIPAPILYGLGSDQTDGSSRATALKLASPGAKVLLVARGEEKLVETKREIEAAGGKAWIYASDVSELASCDALVARVLKEHGSCDYLINNAGRSIRRGIINSFDRFHDFERTMQLNYFGALRLIMGFLPKMIENKRGQIINISSIGVLSNAPRFSAYVASKSALDSFAGCAASEFVDKGISFTTINMPLVRTPMIAPTKMYENVPTLSPEEAADLVVEAIVYKPVRIATRLGVAGAVAHAIAPRLTQIMLNTAFNMFPDSAAAKGKKEGEGELSAEQMAFAQLTQGIHW